MKRLADFLIALISLVLLSGPLILLAILVRAKLGSPVFFTQIRAGKGGRPFLMIKFRTMTSGRDADGQLLPDEIRLTSFGRMLRSTSLDELPELINVLGGQMSLVGPRPLLMDYLSRYSERQARRHEVRPGLTGWAQVNGRNELSWPERLEMDVWYVENHNLSLDFRIVCMTFGKVLKRSGVSAVGHATMPVFTGKEEV
jgi:sugar transferase EpsL